MMHYLLLAIAVWSELSFAQMTFPALPGNNPWDNRPNDPDYKDQWQLFSHLPVDHKNPNVTQFDKDNGSGMGVDLSWQLHTGNSRMRIAVLDSGIRWFEKDLRNRIYLNAGELPFPEGFNTHDVNNDGRFNIEDYISDSRVADHNQNGFLDVEDIILSFSDNLDQDGNGYTDDISGWDFVENDNNPGDRINYGHGTNEGLHTAAEINNGIGSAGICGDCTLMFVRSGDTFIVDSNSFAASVIYATDAGAEIIQNALGGLNNNHFIRYAVNYAYDRDVVVIGTAADETSYHSNQPSITDPIIYPNAVRYDNYLPQDATTFANFNNCSNYGPRLDVTVAALSCSSEATANLGGILGLIKSYSSTLNKVLTAGELISLTKSSATDINFGSNLGNPSRHSTFKGWDSITGFGRVNAWNMMMSLRNKKIPPELRITSPNWFEIYRGSANKSISLKIKIGQPRKGKYKAVVAITRGVDTAESNFIELVTMEDISNGFEGEVAQVSVNDLMKLPANLLDHARYKNAFTFEIKITDEDGMTTAARRTIYAFEDEYLHQNFPWKMRGSGESSGLFTDLDGDGKEEYVTADGSGQIYAFSSVKKLLPGFPAKLPRSRFALKGVDVSPAIVGPIASGDIDADGSPEIVVTSFEGDVVAFDSLGAYKPGFPIRLRPISLEDADASQRLLPGILAAPTLADLTGDGHLEIIVTTLDGHLYIFDSNGDSLSGFPFRVEIGGKRAKIVSSPAVSDMNDDGYLDIIFGSGHRGPLSGNLFVIDGKSIGGQVAYLNGFPTRIPMVRDSILPTIGVGLSMSPAVGDIDADGKKEILVHGVMGKMYAVDETGKIERFFSAKTSATTQVNDSYMLTGLGHPALGVLEPNTPFLNPVGVGVGKKILTSLILGGVRYPYQHMMTAWSVEKQEMLSGFPIATDDIMIFISPTLIDLNGDGTDELLYAGGGNYAHAFKSNGEEFDGFPHFTGGWSISSMNSGDFDGDGLLDIGTTTREGYVFIWKTSARTQRSAESWPTYQGNNQRTGEYKKR